MTKISVLQPQLLHSFQCCFGSCNGHLSPGSQEQVLLFAEGLQGIRMPNLRVQRIQRVLHVFLGHLLSKGGQLGSEIRVSLFIHLLTNKSLEQARQRLLSRPTYPAEQPGDGFID